MHLFPLAILLTPGANALYFSLTALTARDAYVPAEDHLISFTVANPDSPWQIGGASDQPTNCTVCWSACPAEAPTCWTPCLDPGTFARVTPGSYRGAWDFSLDIWQWWVFEVAVHNNATVHIAVGEDGVACEGDGATDGEVCGLGPGGSVNQTLAQEYWIGAPAEICGE